MTTTCPFCGAMEVIVGADGIVFGVAVTEFDASLSPATFTALIFTGYAVPFVKFVVIIIELPATIAEV